jgi:hypothetical protein
MCTCITIVYDHEANNIVGHSEAPHLALAHHRQGRRSAPRSHYHKQARPYRQPLGFVVAFCGRVEDSASERQRGAVAARAVQYGHGNEAFVRWLEECDSWERCLDERQEAREAERVRSEAKPLRGERYWCWCDGWRE